MTSSRLLRWLSRSPVQTFILCPLLVVAFELVRRRGELTIEPGGVVLLAWGYLQYLLVGRFRTHLGGGGPGFGVLPDRIVEDGPYRYVRNPMYLGHLIFMLGLAVTLSRGLHSSCSPRARSGFTAACSRTKRALRRYLDGLISIISGG